ncbi:MAG: hypothetical protein Q8M37_14080 [Nevskia sp.]|nr:hypothetical protein [Nevskia sp.]
MIANPYGDPQRHVVTLTAEQIRSSNCTAVPVHGLVWALLPARADWVTYRLDDEAAALYRFDEDRPLSHNGQGVNRLADLFAESHGVSLTVRIRPRAALKPWTDGHVFFHLVGINGTPNPPPFDPTIPNTGGPRPPSA